MYPNCIKIGIKPQDFNWNCTICIKQ